MSRIRDFHIAPLAAQNSPLLARAPKALAHGSVRDATWAAFSTRFEPSQLLEMIAVVGYYRLISFVANGVAFAARAMGGALPERGQLRSASGATTGTTASASFRRDFMK
ncbi:MAG TPA: hypothetical protein VGI39_41835 [Polyangiaceae bacterium]|jgi:hypothetical protein